MTRRTPLPRIQLERLAGSGFRRQGTAGRSEEHTSELQSQSNLVCRLLLEKKKKIPFSGPGGLPSCESELAGSKPAAPLLAAVWSGSMHSRSITPTGWSIVAAYVVPPLRDD